jgi:hypothetical protein
VKGKVVGEEKDALFWGNSISLLVGSQILLVRPSDKGSVKVKTLERLEAVA